MVEQALNVVNLHIIWKARALTAAAEPSADEIHHRDSLKEQRDSLVEKLIEYAVGTQSNTAEGVKRAVRPFSFAFCADCGTQIVGRHFKYS